MSFRLQSSETIGQGLRRIGLAEVTVSRHSLEGADLSLAAGIHKARRRLKRARSILMVVRPVVGKDIERRLSALKTVGQQLAGNRDLHAMIRAARDLQKLGPVSEEPAYEELIAGLSDGAGGQDAMADVVAASAAKLRAAEADMASLPPDMNGERLLVLALKSAFIAARNGIARAGKGRVGDLHEWRKQVKDLWHLVRLMRKHSSADCKRVERTLDRIGKRLGQEQDLFVLSEKIAAQPELMSDESHRQTVLSRISQRRAELAQDALQRGEQIFSDTPKWFLRRVPLSVVDIAE